MTTTKLYKSMMAGTLGAALAVSITACAPADTDAGNSAGGVSGDLRILVGSADASDRALQLMNEAFEDAYPDVSVEFASVPNENYAATKSSRMTAGNVDIVVGGPRQLPEWVPADAEEDESRAVRAGVYRDLSDQPFVDRFTSTLMDSLLFEGRHFQMPLGVTYYNGVYYNKSIFEQYGLNVPTTWSEFLEVAETLQSNGVTPLGLGGRDGWPAGLLQLAAVHGAFPTQADKLSLSEGLWTGEIALDDPVNVDILEKVETLYGLAQPNFAGVGYETIPAGFAAGDFAMTIDGTWNQTTIDIAVGDAFEYGYFPLPANEDPALTGSLAGKVELRLLVPSNAPNPEAALAWLDFVSTPENYASFLEVAGYAPAQPDIEATDFNNEISVYGFEPAWDVLWNGNPLAGPLAVFPHNYMSIAPIGTSSALEAAQLSQADWAAGLAAIE